MANQKPKKTKRPGQSKKTDDKVEDVNDGATTSEAANASNKENEIFGKEKWLQDIRKEFKNIHKGKKRAFF